MTEAPRRVSLALVEDGAHYDDVLERLLREARVSVWISTANVKDVRVEAPIGTRDRAAGRWTTFLARLWDLSQNGIDVRLLHGGKPSRAFAATERALLAERGNAATVRRPTAHHCMRVHLKLVLVDGRWAYFGSANLTGAGLGGKGDGRRNFELGAIVDDDVILDRLQERFDRIFRGAECASCTLRRECPAPLDVVKKTSVSLSGPRTRTPRKTAPK